MTTTSDIWYTVYHQAQYVDHQPDGNNTYLEELGEVAAPLQQPELALQIAKAQYPGGLLLVQPTADFNQAAQLNYLEAQAQ